MKEKDQETPSSCPPTKVARNEEKQGKKGALFPPMPPLVQEYVEMGCEKAGVSLFTEYAS